MPLARSSSPPHEEASFLSWFVFSIGKSTPRNWDLCKEVGAYGVSVGSGRPKVKEEDRILIWLGGRGYVAEAIATGPPTEPSTEEEVPWPGGLDRYAYVVPIRLVAEVREPINFRFIGRVQPETGVKTSHLQRGIASISDPGAIKISTAIRERAVEEGQTPNMQKELWTLKNVCPVLHHKRDRHVRRRTIDRHRWQEALWWPAVVGITCEQLAGSLLLVQTVK